MSIMREPLNPFRAEFVEKVYDSIDPDHAGQIHYSELCKI